MTPTQKPRIKRYYYHEFRRMMWICICQKMSGLSDTPDGAYRAWLRNMHFHGFIE